MPWGGARAQSARTNNYCTEDRGRCLDENHLKLLILLNPQADGVRRVCSAFTSHLLSWLDSLLLARWPSWSTTSEVTVVGWRGWNKRRQRWSRDGCPGRTNKFSWTNSSWPKFCLLWTYSYGSMAFFFFQTTIWQRKCVKLSFGNSWKLDVIFFFCAALLLVGTCAVHHEKPNGAPV